MITPSQSNRQPHNPNEMLRRGLIEPSVLASLTLSDWNYLVPEARAAGLLARLDALLEEHALFDRIPAPVVPHLIAARRIADHEHRTISWEVNRIGRALTRIATRVVLLKGAAYLQQGLPVAKGRMSSDVDILVSKDALESVEAALVNHGWRHLKLDEYDQFFYRQWSHELPPLQHRDRGTVVDVHHTILPPTGRLHPDPEKLLRDSVPLHGNSFRALAPPDMVLHSAAHAFQDGDLARGLRDLVDIDALLRHFSAEDEQFWARLANRAEELRLIRPLYYALRYSHRFLQTVIPADIARRMHRWRSSWPAATLMDNAVKTVITGSPSRKNLSLRLARKLLYVRAHWLRMPPHLLIPHLARKAFPKTPVKN
jgi:hypothetical protein